MSTKGKEICRVCGWQFEAVFMNICQPCSRRARGIMQAIAEYHPIYFGLRERLELAVNLLKTRRGLG